MRVLITGGFGFIGRSISKLLLENGVDLVVLDNFTPQIHGKTINKHNFLSCDEEIIFGSVLERDKVREAIAGVDIVIHLAAETGTAQSMYLLNSYTETNVNGTSILLEEILNAKRRPSKFILASSRSIYGEGKYECSNKCKVEKIERSINSMRNHNFVPTCEHCGQHLSAVATPENFAPNCRSVYASTKLMQEMLVENALRATNVEYNIARFQNVYGPGQSLNNPYTGIVSIFYKLAKNNDEILLFEQGLPLRDFIYIDDVTNVVRLLIEKSVSSKIINVGTGKATSVAEIANMIKISTHSESPITKTNQFRNGDIFQNYADTKILSSLTENINFTPICEGIDKFISWAENQPKSDNEKYYMSLAEARSSKILES